MHGFKKEVLEWSNSFQKVKKKGKKKNKTEENLIKCNNEKEIFLVQR